MILFIIRLLFGTHKQKNDFKLSKLVKRNFRAMTNIPMLILR